MIIAQKRHKNLIFVFKCQSVQNKGKKITIFMRLLYLCTDLKGTSCCKDESFPHS